MRTRSLLVAIAVGLVPCITRGDGDVELRLEYRGAPGCPGPITFRTQVTGRTPRARFGESGRAVTVELRKTASGYRGTMRFEGEERAIDASTCDEVVAGLAVALSLKLEPEGATSTATATATATGTATATATATAPATAPATATATATATASGASIEVAPFVGVSTGIAPRAVVTFGGVAALRLDRRVVVRAAGLTTTTGTIDAAPGLLRAHVTAARVGVCPFAFVASGPFDLRPCLDVETGVLVVRVEGLERARDARRLWAAIDLSLSASVVPVAPLFVAVEIGAGALLARDRFVLVDGHEVHRPPPFRALGMLALGVRF